MTSRIPPLLSPYIRLSPPDSLTLVTGILGASANWVILRYLYAALNDGRGADSAEFGNQGDGDVAVVLVSWMRDWEFWRTEAKRAVVRWLLLRRSVLSYETRHV